MNYSLGIDVGGSNVRLALVDSSGSVLASKIFSWTGEREVDGLIALVSKGIDEILASNSGIRPSAIGCGIAGSVDFKRGILHYSPHLKGWCNVNLKDLFTNKFGLKVCVDNDANAAAVAEHMWGKARGWNDFVILTLGTGIGCGLFLDGKIYRGEMGFAGEAGHMTIDMHGPKCECGNKGCWEIFAASQSFSYHISKLKWWKRRALKEDGAELLKMAQGGNDGAKIVWRKVGQGLGVGISSLVNVFGVTKFVIGGGISNAWDYFMPWTKESLYSYSYKDELKKIIVIEKASFAQLQGAVGAAGLAMADLC